MAGRLRFGVSTPGGPLADDDLTGLRAAMGRTPDIELWYEDFASSPPVDKVARSPAEAPPR
jgi:hypothetical protein